ncbi:MAG: hypothetical protein DMD78_18805 [Candidatus Rokuibacteriota bacterium]|nr:MAG: hypothetical protein DMD78_18805 [Candidatus Rokubacteria bacterium]
MALLRVVMIAVLLAAAGCGGSGDATDVRALASWAATTDMVAAAWTQHEVPRRYSLRAVGRARQALTERGRHLDALPAAARARVGEALQRLDRAVAELAEAIERGDRTGAVPIRARLQAEARTLGEVAAGLEARS